MAVMALLTGLLISTSKTEKLSCNGKTTTIHCKVLPIRNCIDLSYVQGT